MKEKKHILTISLTSFALLLGLITASANVTPYRSADIGFAGNKYIGLNEKQSDKVSPLDTTPRITRALGDKTGTPAAPAPEPATMLLFCTGLVGLAGVVKRKKM